VTTFALTVNGRLREFSLAPRVSLADALREGCGLTGTHLGCEHGVCGACTVLLDGQPARSCITFAIACAGAEVTTIEGLDDDDLTAELREAFRRHHALQCGYCTPGMVISARDLALRLPLADDRAIRIGLSGNLCRCTGYVGVVAAVKEVIAARRERGVTALPGAGRTILGPVGAQAAAAMVAGPTPVADRVDETALAARPADFQPTHAFAHSFQLAQPADRVFAHFADVRAVAAAIPGLVVTQASANHAEGSFTVALGPITARFRGEAEISRDEAARSGRILAAGGDLASRSRARGAIDYCVAPGASGAGSTVELQVGYSLTGLLAQLGRPGLIEAVAGRLIADFAQNLERQLAGQSATASLGQTRLSLPAVFAAALRDWVARIGRGGR
jgi:aerobic carbon-monoxide dehydrogenase small subunit